MHYTVGVTPGAVYVIPRDNELDNVINHYRLLYNKLYIKYTYYNSTNSETLKL